MGPIPEKTLQAIERRFHDVILGRAGRLVDEHALELPKLAELLEAEERKAWFPVPGMYGGFSYWLEGEGETVVLVASSWCRVVDGSGQQHRISADETVLVDEGFV